MNDNIKVSVIVPVYNAKQYLNQCLDSIVNQTLKEIEIICVDDGSDDGSLDILKEYAEKDSRVRVMNQEHKYAGMARNLGKSVAKGKYLVFWDSDDYFDSEALQKMYDQCESDEADVCICGGRQFFEDTGFENPCPRYLRPAEIPETIPFNSKTEPDHVMSITVEAPWNKMFRREYIENLGLDFQGTRNANDVYFVENALCQAERITVIRDKVVCYRKNKESGLVASVSKGLMTALGAWLDTAENLRKVDKLPERSFANRALESVLYLLNNTGDYDTFKDAFLFLQDGKLDELCIKYHPENDDYYHIDWHNEAAKKLHECTPEQFSKWIGTLMYKKETASVGLMRHYREEAKLEIKELNKQINYLERHNGYLTKDINALKGSVSYKVGRFLTWVPRTVKAVIKGEEKKG